MPIAWLESHAMTHHQEGAPDTGNGSREVEYKGGFEYARGKQAKKSYSGKSSSCDI